MLKRSSRLCLLVVLLATAGTSAADPAPSTLAADYTVVARSADPQHAFLGTPAIARLPSGCPMPGGQNKFHIVRDAQTGL